MHTISHCPQPHDIHVYSVHDYLLYLNETGIFEFDPNSSGLVCPAQLDTMAIGGKSVTSQRKLDKVTTRHDLQATHLIWLT